MSYIGNDPNTPIAKNAANTANAAFVQANSSLLIANLSFDRANSVNSATIASFGLANTANAAAIAAFTQANTISNLTFNSQSTNYTAVQADANRVLFHPTADTTARTFTIPANSSVPYQIGTSLTFINHSGAGNVTIAITSDTMRMAPYGNTGSRNLVANGIATAIKTTYTEWIINGSGLY